MLFKLLGCRTPPPNMRMAILNSASKWFLGPVKGRLIFDNYTKIISSGNYAGLCQAPSRYFVGGHLRLLVFILSGRLNLQLVQVLGSGWTVLVIFILFTRPSIDSKLLKLYFAFSTWMILYSIPGAMDVAFITGTETGASGHLGLAPFPSRFALLKIAFPGFQF